MKDNWKTKLKSQVLIFIVLFLIVEIILRICGMRAGTLDDELLVEESPVYFARFFSDEVGINHILPANDLLLNGTVLNEQGFRGNINYTPAVIDSIRKNTGREIVMVVGDSFVEGCCVDSVSHSFPDLMNKNGKYEILNFGVAGTDPLQYELIVKKYVTLLKPDRIIVAVFFGNDTFYYGNRQPSPGVPLTFPFKKNKWINAWAPDFLSGRLHYTFKNPQEAYTFYVDNYTLKGNTRSIFEKTISYSVIFSKIYLNLEHRRRWTKWRKEHPNLHEDGTEVAQLHLQNIKNTCDSLNVACLLVGIPSPYEAAEGQKLKDKYKSLFKNLTWYVPDNITVKDYDGPNISNHFNEEGHRKYTDFLISLLEKTKTNKP